MSEQQSSYRQIMKATSIFGGVQIFTIIISIVRSKIIAVLLGPVGIGINSLLMSTTNLIAGLSNFGLGTSAVKYVAAEYGTGNSNRIATVVTVTRRLVWATGLLGTILIIILSPWLSQLTFGNKDYTLAFIWISITLLLNQISTGQGVILRGMRKINYLARASLSGAVLGLLVSAPIYYQWGIDGIVPAIIISSIVNLINTWYFASKVKTEKVSVSRETTLVEGKKILVMGFMLSLSGLYVLAKNYGIRAYIANAGGMDEVGLYSAGITIVNTYVGMVFTSMSTDYFPRLSALANDNAKARDLINQQAEIAILILAPLITVFIVFIGWVVLILYSNKFLPITQMIQWAALGIFFKALSWSMAFMQLAKGKSKMFLANELFGGTITLICQLGGYILGGLTGMGVGFMVGYFYYMFQVYFVSRKYFDFSFDPNLLKVLILLLSLAILSFVFVIFLPSPWFYVAGIPVILFSTIYSLKELDKRVGLKKILKIK